MAVFTVMVRLPLFIFSCALFFSACVVVKNQPVGQPYVHKTNVHVEGPLSDVQRKQLALDLAGQFQDSITVRNKAKFIGWDKAPLKIIPRFFYELQNAPATFDSINAGKSLQFMRDYLNSLGYFRDSINYTVKIDSSKDKKNLPATIDFYVWPNTVTKLDSIGYRLNTDTSANTNNLRRGYDTIQQITLNNLKETLIKKGDPFSRYSLSAERDRLAVVFRDNGYLRFSEEEVLVLWDTVGIDLLRPAIDPIEQALLLQRLAERRANPRADVEFRLRSNPDTTRIIRYYVGDVTIFPEFTADTSADYRFTDTAGRFLVKHNQRLFKRKIFRDYIFLRPGNLYRQSDYQKTQAKFSGLPAWRLVTIVPKPRPGQDTADFDIRLTPARKYAYNARVEVSRNQSNLAIAQGNLLGLGFVTGIQNRNFGRGANQSAVNFRYGTELNANTDDLIQTRQVSLGYSLQIPRLVPAFMRGLSRDRENTTATILSLNAGRTDRRDYFNLTSLNASWGYQINKRNLQVTFRFPNLEYNLLQKKDSLDTLISKNSSYAYIFNTGVIVSLPINVQLIKSSGNVTRLVNGNLEFAGYPGALRRTFRTNLYRFVRFDLEFTQTHKLARNAFAWRLFGGVGISNPFSAKDSANFYLPFFRQYVAGGPNSMRAWAIRRLGPGSYVGSFARTENPDRFGDMRLEANAEYRIHLLAYGAITLSTALFTDIGNVWFLRKNDNFPNGEFRLANLWRDIGIGAGTGLRVDLSTFIKIRVDYAYKVKNPTPEEVVAQNKWFYGWQLFNGQIQLGIAFPF